MVDSHRTGEQTAGEIDGVGFQSMRHGSMNFGEYPLKFCSTPIKALKRLDVT
jgi:hypothetical protein